MGERKTVFKYFTIPQYQQEEAFLSSMHEKGWRLARITFPGFYHFHRCEPGKVAYRLDYNQEGMRDKSAYVRMFSDCGWEYLFDFVGYSYFCKEGAAGDGREEIFCDDASRLDMMKRVFKGRIIPLILLFAGVVLPQLVLNTLGHNGGGALQDVLSFCFMGLAMVYLAIFGVMAYQFYQYESRLLPEDVGVKYKYWGVAFLILLIVVGIGVFFYLSKRSVYSISKQPDGFTVEAGQLNKPVSMGYYLKKGDRIAVEHDFDGGELFIRIGEEGKDPVFYGNSFGEMDDFTIEVQEDGYYVMECSGRNAKGAVRFMIQ